MSIEEIRDGYQAAISSVNKPVRYEEWRKIGFLLSEIDRRDAVLNWIADYMVRESNPDLDLVVQRARDEVIPQFKKLSIRDYLLLPKKK